MSSSSEGAQICYLLILLISIGFLIWGFIELLRPSGHNEQEGKNKKGEKVTAATISRQIRGFALIMLAHIVFVLGIAVCTRLTGGVSGAAKKILA